MEILVYLRDQKQEDILNMACCLGGLLLHCIRKTHPEEQLNKDLVSMWDCESGETEN